MSRLPVSSYRQPAQAPASTSRRGDHPVALFITHLFGPVNLAGAVVVVTALHASGLAGLAWAALAATFVAGLPFVYLLRGVRRGRWTDIHVGVREQRPAVLRFGLGSVCTGLAILWLASGPRQLIALVLAMVVGLVALSAVTLVWKISFHTGVASGVLAVLALQFGPPALLGTLVLIVIGWSRTRLGDHTLAQVCAGAVVGGALGACVYALVA
ncbi:MAG TPA: hypothetical protein VFN61_04765 [Acidimicrobiales bacterium]|nr:hypothetical protein [Acidimicrobiales bacterium]